MKNQYKKKGKLISMSYEEYEILCGKLVKKIQNDIFKNEIEFSGIYAFPRGGLPLGVHLSHKLNLPLLEKPNKECLLVDDISDRGITSKRVKRKKFACLYSTSWTRTTPDYFIKLKRSKLDWIYFPWECFEQENMKVYNARK